MESSWLGQRPGLRAGVLFLLLYWRKIPDKSELRKEGFVWLTVCEYSHHERRA